MDTTPGRSAPLARLVIADGHDLARAGLRAIFDDTRDMFVIGEAVDGQAALALCSRLQPRLAVLDMRLPLIDGLAATRAIKAACPRTGVLLVSCHGAPDHLVEALRVGAAGYLLKETSREQILATARRILNGEMVLARPQDADPRHHAGEQGEQLTHVALTVREREVLQLVTEGRTNREVAAELKISPGTVKNHVEHIIAKLDVSDRTQAAVYALRHGLLAS